MRGRRIGFWSREFVIEGWFEEYIYPKREAAKSINLHIRVNIEVEREGIGRTTQGPLLCSFRTIHRWQTTIISLWRRRRHTRRRRTGWHNGEQGSSVSSIMSAYGGHGTHWKRQLVRKWIIAILASMFAAFRRKWKRTNNHKEREKGKKWEKRVKKKGETQQSIFIKRERERRAYLFVVSICTCEERLRWSKPKGSFAGSQTEPRVLAFSPSISLSLSLSFLSDWLCWLSKVRRHCLTRFLLSLFIFFSIKDVDSFNGQKCSVCSNSSSNSNSFVLFPSPLPAGLYVSQGKWTQPHQKRHVFHKEPQKGVATTNNNNNKKRGERKKPTEAVGNEPCEFERRSSIKPIDFLLLPPEVYASVVYLVVPLYGTISYIYIYVYVCVYTHNIHFYSLFFSLLSFTSFYFSSRRYAPLRRSGKCAAYWSTCITKKSDEYNQTTEHTKQLEKDEANFFPLLPTDEMK